MNIAICTDTFVPMTNGVAVFVDNLSRGLAKNGENVLVIAPSFKKRFYRERRSDVAVYHLTSARFPFFPDEITPVAERKKLFRGRISAPRLAYKNGLWWATNSASEVSKILEKFQPDIIHVQTNGPIGISAHHYANRHDIAEVITNHNYPDTLGTGQLKLLRPIKKPIDAVMKAYIASFIKNSDFTTMPTEVAIADLMPDKKRFLRIPTAAISNGIDLSSFKPGSAPDALYKRFHLKKSDPVVLHVGRLDGEKSVDVVLDAFALVLKKLPTTKLLVVGDGTVLGKLKKQARALGIEKNTIFPGRIYPPTLNQLYQLGTVFVTASEVETQGIVLLEAAATGLPLVVVDRGAAGEICHDKENGFLCPPKDPSAMSRALLKLLTDKSLRTTFSQNSLSVAKSHDLRTTVRRFRDVYAEAYKINLARTGADVPKSL